MGRIPLPHPAQTDIHLHPSFPIRRMLWRPESECELAVVWNDEFSSGSGSGGEANAGARPGIGGGVGRAEAAPAGAGAVETRLKFGMSGGMGGWRVCG